jgi:membrane fusion protein
MQSELFRKEVLDGQQTKWAGKIVLNRPTSMLIAACFSMMLVTVVILFLCLGGYTRKVRVGGQIAPAEGAVKAVASESGRVVKRAVEEGDLVRQGQLLYELTSERTNASGSIDQRISESIAGKKRY